jgi:hypothetical protein
LQARKEVLIKVVQLKRLEDLELSQQQLKKSETHLLGSLLEEQAHLKEKEIKLTKARNELIQKAVEARREVERLRAEYLAASERKMLEDQDRLLSVLLIEQEQLKEIEQLRQAAREEAVLAASLAREEEERVRLEIERREQEYLVRAEATRRLLIETRLKDQKRAYELELEQKEMAKLAAEEEERKRLEEEARIAEEARFAEQARLAEEKRVAEEQARLAEEKRIAQEARIAEEARLAEEKRIADDAERKRLEEAKAAAEAEAMVLAEAEEARRLKAEEEAKALAEAQEAARLKVEEEEALLKALTKEEIRLQELERLEEEYADETLNADGEFDEDIVFEESTEFDLMVGQDEEGIDEIEATTSLPSQQEQVELDPEAKIIAETIAKSDEMYIPSENALSNTEILLKEVRGPLLTEYDSKENFFTGRNVGVYSDSSVSVPVRLSIPGTFVEYTIEKKGYDFYFGINAFLDDTKIQIKVCIRLILFLLLTPLPNLLVTRIPFNHFLASLVAVTPLHGTTSRSETTECYCNR